jgi:hypothetical protein
LNPFRWALTSSFRRLGWFGSLDLPWEIYRDFPEFETTPFLQFKGEFLDYWSKADHRYAKSLVEAAALQHDRKLHPRATHNENGEPVFDLSPAKNLLRADVQEGKHIGISPAQFQRTRQDYMAFPPDKFKHRIYQEVRRMKFIYYLECKRNT